MCEYSAQHVTVVKLNCEKCVENLLASHPILYLYMYLLAKIGFHGLGKYSAVVEGRLGEISVP